MSASRRGGAAASQVLPLGPPLHMFSDVALMCADDFVCVCVYVCVKTMLSSPRRGVQMVPLPGAHWPVGRRRSRTAETWLGVPCGATQTLVALSVGPPQRAPPARNYFSILPSYSKVTRPMTFQKFWQAGALWTTGRAGIAASTASTTSAASAAGTAAADTSSEEDTGPRTTSAVIPRRGAGEVHLILKSTVSDLALDSEKYALY